MAYKEEIDAKRLYAKEKLPKQMHMSSLLRQYFDQKYESHYVLDDYIILAKKAEIIGEST
ncbi:hypothetical protein [Scytonema hofmannii]|nr:hypothetical protein [Scytonema hofmannii]